MTAQHRNDFSDRLNLALSKKEIPERGRAVIIAKMFGITPKAVGKWLKGESLPETGKLIELAEWLNESVEWLLTGNKNNDFSLDKNVNLDDKKELGVKKIPLLSWEQVQCLHRNAIMENMEIKSWLPPHEKCGKNGYGLQIVGSSMSPKFIPGDFIYVNPDFPVKDLKTDDLVVVRSISKDEASFRKLIIEGKDKFLQAINPEWPEPILKLNEDHQILGKVVGLFRDI